MNSSASESSSRAGTTLDSAKNTGGAGSLLLVVGVLLFISGINTFSALVIISLLIFVGFILILVALEDMADFYGDKRIFRSALYAFIAGIIGTVVFIVTSTVTSMAFNTIAQEQTTNLRAYTSQLIASTNLMLNSQLVIVLVFSVITMVLFRDSLGRLSTKTHVRLFGITGWFMILSAILVALVSTIPIWIGCILLTMAFFSIKTKQPQPPNIKPP